MNNNIIKGYKVFNADWKCRDKQYACPGYFEEDVELMLCQKGMHFCLKASDCFSYYDFNSNYHVCEVIAHGDVVKDKNKCCTNKLEIVREIPWSEVLEIVNEGKNCTGDCNTGDWNTGDWNTGDCNTGNRNTGDRNTGNWNTGDRNTGDRNTGDRNTGNWNTGDWNTGDWNTGDCNTGDWNTGDWNTGDCNTGNRNTGNWNTGDWNTGNRNTGDWNTGDWNTGDWNTGSNSSGCFNTITQPIIMFNKSCDWTLDDWRRSDARYYLNEIPKNLLEWIIKDDMTEEEKTTHPEYETTGGYLKMLDETECAQVWWDAAPEYKRRAIMELPNFDAKIFEKCTGIKIKEEDL